MVGTETVGQSTWCTNPLLNFSHRAALVPLRDIFLSSHCNTCGLIITTITRYHHYSPSFTHTSPPHPTPSLSSMHRSTLPLPPQPSLPTSPVSSAPPSTQHAL